MRTIIVLLILVGGAGAMWSFGLPDPHQDPPTDPVTLIPGNSFLVVHFDGYTKHQPAITETAAWKALKDTGLEARVFDLLTMGLNAMPDGGRAAELVPEAIQHVMNHGGTIAASISASGQEAAPLAILILPEGDGSSTIVQDVLQLLEQQAGQDLQRREIQGRSVLYSESPAQPGLEIALWRESGNLIVGIGINAAHQIIQTADGNHVSLADNVRWQQLRSREEFTVDCFGWFDPGILLDQFGDMQIPDGPPGDPLTVRQIADWLGLANLKGITFQGGYSGAATWSHAALTCDGQMTGLLSLLDQHPLTLEDLPPLPHECASFAAARFDLLPAMELVLEKVGDAVLRLGGEGQRADYDQGVDTMLKSTGGDLASGLFAGIGDIWCVYSDTAALPIPIGVSPALAVNIRDRDKVLNGLDRLIQLAESLPDSDKIRIRRTERDNAVTVSVSINDVPLFVPTLAITDQWLVIGITPSTAQTFVMRQSGRLPSWKPGDAVAAALAELPDAFSSITVSDPAPGYQQLLSFAPMLMTMLETQVLPNVAPEASLPFGLDEIPPAELVTASMFPNVAVAGSISNGFESYSRSSVPSTPVGSIGATAVIPVLIALLLPAVQQAREAARRTQSRNNLRQMGIAIQNYEDVFGHFPRGTVDTPGLMPEDRVGWVYGLLPHLEQAAIYNQIRPDTVAKGWKSVELETVRSVTIPVLQNPSMPRRDAAGSMDYVGISGIGPNSASLPGNDRRAGIFGFDRVTRVRDITDGTSYTLMIGDAAVPNASYLAGGSESVRGFSQKPYLNGPDNIGSSHRGIVQFLMADGSVRSISVNIDEQVLEALATKAGNETIGDF